MSLSVTNPNEVTLVCFGYEEYLDDEEFVEGFNNGEFLMVCFNNEMTIVNRNFIEMIKIYFPRGGYANGVYFLYPCSWEYFIIESLIEQYEFHPD